METLYSYILEMLCESQQRTKSQFITQDYYKTNHTYALDVLRQILVHGFIETKDFGSVKIEYNDSELQKLRAYFKYNEKTRDFDITKKPSTVEEWNDMLGEIGIPKWQTIWKGKFSNSKLGQIMESLVCYLFNDENADVLAWSNKFTDVNPQWEESCRKLAEFIGNTKTSIQWDRNNFTAYHVDGQDFQTLSEDGSSIAKIFKGDKDFIKKLTKYDCSDLYKVSKDAWNKADIVLIRKDMESEILKEIIDHLQTFGINSKIKITEDVSNGAILNNKLIELTQNDYILPISLKKVDGRLPVHLSSVGMQENESTGLYIAEVDSIRLGKLTADKMEGNTSLFCQDADGNSIDLCFRANTNGNNGLNIEPKSVKGKYRYGKAISIVKDILGLPRDNSYYIEMESDEDCIKALENYGFKVDTKISTHKKYEDGKWPLRKRACMAGLLGVLKAYKDKNPNINKNDFPINFTNFIYMCSTGILSTGCFYKLSN